MKRPSKLSNSPMAAGSTPTRLVSPPSAEHRAGEEAGIPVNRGIVVDDVMRTGAPDVFAIGECADTAASAMAWSNRPTSRRGCWRGAFGGEEVSYGGSVVATNLKVSGVSVFSAGDFMGADGSESIVLSDIKHGNYEAGDRGGALDRRGVIGDVGDALWYLELIHAPELRLHPFAPT